MKIEEISEEEKIVRVRVTSMDDLWVLNNFIEKGDKIFGVIFRKLEEKSDRVRSKKEERIRIRVGIEVEEVEFQEFTDRLRIKGRIIDGPEEYLGHYQSLNISIGDTVEILKNNWSRVFLDELQKSEKESFKALFVSLDDEGATIALLRDYGIQVLAEISLNRPSKEVESGETNYREILMKLEQYWNEDTPIFIAGPGFFKENFLKAVPEGKMKSSMIMVDTSYAGEKGIYEALKAGVLEKILKENRMKREIMMVSSLLEEISKEGKYAYGLEEVSKYAEMGAIDILLISDKFLKDKNFKNLMEKVEKSGGKVYIISSHHEYGKMLNNLGGIGALLRYKISA